MRRISLKGRARNSEAVPWRQSRVRQCPVCWLCRCRRTVEIHEIARGSRSRHKAMDKPFATLPVCRECHDGPLSDTAKWPESRQLALIKLWSPNDHDLVQYNRLVGFGPNRITAADVAQWEIGDEWC